MKNNTLKFVHITDTHLLNQPDETFYGINTKKSLERVLSHCQTQQSGIDFMLVTGDISQTGDTESYTIFQSLIQKLDFPVYCIPGNHDIPENMQPIITDCPDDSIKIIKLGNYSLVLLSSWVKNKEYGVVSQQSLQQLDEHLQNSHKQFTIIAIHHPPILINSKWLDELGLQNKAELLKVINKYSGNTLVLFGHIHQAIDQQLDKLRLLSTPSTCHQFEAYVEHMHNINTPPPAYRIIRIDSNQHIETTIHYIE